MIIRFLIAVAVVYIVWRIYLRVFRQKRCVNCSTYLEKEAQVCSRCNTIQP